MQFSLTCINPGIDYSTSIQYNHLNNSKPNVVPQIVINIVIKMKLCLCLLIISTGKESDETKGNLKWRPHGLGQWHDYRNKEFARGLGKYFLLDQYLTADKNVQYGSHILLHHNKGIQQWDTKELHMCAFFLESSQRFCKMHARYITLVDIAFTIAFTLNNNLHLNS